LAAIGQTVLATAEALRANLQPRHAVDRSRGDWHRPRAGFAMTLSYENRLG
jgi:hypothetical protein